MSFHSKKRKFALRVFSGCVNAVTGKTVDETKISDQSSSHTQDYIVVPGQPWLDGIQVREGVVRQFVAMPLSFGYTVEGQKTGEEKHGGLQIEVIPEYQKGLREWLPDNLSAAFMTNILAGTPYHGLTETSTPSELNLHAGEKIRSYPPSLTFEKPVEISDLIDSDETEVNLTATRELQSLISRSYGRHSALETGDAWYNDMEIEHPRRGNARKKNSRAMGLAAGGKLIQDIYRDRNPPRTWNTAATRIINIHLLDPATCESITYIVPPPPPIDMKDYVKYSLPFFVVEE